MRCVQANHTGEALPTRDTEFAPSNQSLQCKSGTDWQMEIKQPMLMHNNDTSRDARATEVKSLVCSTRSALKFCFYVGPLAGVVWVGVFLPRALPLVYGTPPPPPPSCLSAPVPLTRSMPVVK